MLSYLEHSGLTFFTNSTRNTESFKNSFSYLSHAIKAIMFHPLASMIKKEEFGLEIRDNKTTGLHSTVVLTIFSHLVAKVSFSRQAFTILIRLVDSISICLIPVNSKSPMQLIKLEILDNLSGNSEKQQLTKDN